MGKINWARVLLGGLVWGLVANVLWTIPSFFNYFEEFRIVLQALGRPVPERSVFVLVGVLFYAFGVVAIWLYAAIRPRYGPGPKTAAVAGLVLWFILALADTVWGAVLSLPISFWATSLGIWLVIMVAATMVGAWLYKEA